MPEDVHTVSRNASATKAARFLVFFVKDKGAPPVLPAKLRRHECMITSIAAPRHHALVTSADLACIAIPTSDAMRIAR